MKRTIYLILTILATTAFILAGCGGSFGTAEEPDYAIGVVEPALESLSNGDYSTYIALFNEESSSMLTEEAFDATFQLITGKIGEYESKTFTEVKIEGGYTVVYYKARFTEETSDVEVRAVFQEEDGEMKLTGFWLDSPGLRK